jgi:hypothetical protein
VIRRAGSDEAAALTALIMRSKAHLGYSQQQLDGWRSALTISFEGWLGISAHAIQP